MTTKNEKGQRIVELTPELLEDFLVRGGRIKTDLPEDARLTSLWVDDVAWNYMLKFESSEWETMNEGERIPTIEVRGERIK